MKQSIKIYLEKEDLDKLKAKCGDGRGALNEYIRKIANEPVVFLDSNAKILIEALKLKST